MRNESENKGSGTRQSVAEALVEVERAEAALKRAVEALGGAKRAEVEGGWKALTERAVDDGEAGQDA